ncbi:hypothetical protein VTO42DRAFT_4419 [Malbranchea cinnamomea]
MVAQSTTKGSERPNKRATESDQNAAAGGWVWREKEEEEGEAKMPAKGGPFFSFFFFLKFFFFFPPLWQTQPWEGQKVRSADLRPVRHCRVVELCVWYEIEIECGLSERWSLAKDKRWPATRSRRGCSCSPRPQQSDAPFDSFLFPWSLQGGGSAREIRADAARWSRRRRSDW